MKLQYSVAAAMGCGIALGSFAATAHAVPSLRAAVHDEQRAIDYIVRASVDLAHGRRGAAIASEERAETVLLNAQQADDYKAPIAIAALERARTDLLRHKDRAGGYALNEAENALFTPRRT